MIESFRILFAPPRHLILIVAALWIGLALAEKRSERHGVSKESLNNLTFYSLLGYIIGGRVLYALANFLAFAPSPLSLFSPNPDLFDPSAAIVSAMIVGVVYGKRQNLAFWGTLDSLFPVFAVLAMGLHLSHLAAGTAFGSPTDLPWGIELWNATRHPTQIYELIASLVIFGLLWFRKSDSSPGILFLNFAALTAGARLFLEAFRVDSTLIFGEFRLAQIVAWVVMATVLLAKESLGQRKESG
ncbi:MAG TPA: prolipoprotein diacylglyceryl transferase family protein [Anaerolineales bacterium]|nr:prolipoprotein diacylglyceryl transferase family protein [Anaerolineales bacterium]